MTDENKSTVTLYTCIPLMTITITDKTVSDYRSEQ